MYQLGLASASLEVPRMSVTLGANRWASRVVVVLQLAAWTAVGIVLLQKGVSSLQKTARAARNVTQLNQSETVVANLMMKTILEDGSSASSSREDRWRGIDGGIDNSEIKENSNPTESNFAPRLTANHLSGLSRSRDEEKVKVWNTGKDLHEEFTKDKNNNNNNNNPTSSGEEDEDEEDEEDDEVEEEDEEAEEEGNSSDASTSTTSIPFGKSTASITRLISDTVDRRSDNISEARRNSRPSDRQSGGAAAAVAMVAVGAIMLILGPAVIILRALDERRQERRFLKLSGQDDLPPSYEQATLMDEAPRYSTLSLNTILGASSTVETLASTSDRCDRDPSSVQQV